MSNESITKKQEKPEAVLFNNVWKQKGLDYPKSQRIKKMHQLLIDLSLTDRSGEWFDQQQLDAKYDIVGKNPDDSVILRRAKAIDAMLQAMTDETLAKERYTNRIHDGDLLLGNMTMGSNGLGKVFPAYLTKDEQRAASITNRGSLSLFGHNSINYEDLVNKGLKDVIARCDAGIAKQDKRINSVGDLEVAIEKLVRRESDAGQQKDFYLAVKTACQAVIDYAARFADIAEVEAAKAGVSAARKQELTEMARIARKVPQDKADTFQEAMQSIWFFHLALHAGMNFISLGRLDQVLNPFLEKEGIDGYGKCLEIFECFMLKAAWRLNLNLTPANINKQDHVDNNTVLGVNPYLIDQKAGINNFLQNIIIGGVKPNGSDATNDCTYLILKAYAQVNVSTPGLYIRVGDNTPEMLKQAVVSVWDTTANNPAIINDRTMIPAMHSILEKGLDATYDYLARFVHEAITNLSQPDRLALIEQAESALTALSGKNADGFFSRQDAGIGLGTLTAAIRKHNEQHIQEIANDFCVDGCWEPILNGRSDWTFAMLCALTPMECALNQGAKLSDNPELLIGEKVAPRTEKPKSFDQLMQIFAKHLSFFVDQSVISLFKYYMIDEYSSPSPLMSAYLDGCMKYGRDKSWGGVEYNIGGIILSGVPDVVNTLAAFKKWVIFDHDDSPSATQKYQFDDVVNALRADFKSAHPNDPNDPVQKKYDQIKIDFNTNTPAFGNSETEVDIICKQVLDAYADAVKESARFAKKTFQTKPRPQDEARIKALRCIAGYYGESLEEKFGAFNMMISAGLGTFEQYNWSSGSNAACAGRMRGAPMTPNFSPTPGTVSHGFSGITGSLKALSLERFAGGVITDICIQKPEHDVSTQLISALDNFIDADGGMMTLTIGDTNQYQQIYEEVLSAQSYPDDPSHSQKVTQELLKKHAHVNVRIGGWQTPFITLPVSHMQNYVKRPIKA